MAAKLDIPPVSQFQIGNDLTNVSQRWEEWLKRFKYYIDAAAVTNAKQKRALLLHMAGPEVQDVFDTLENTGDNFDQAVAKINEYFKPYKNTGFGRHAFKQAEQQESETVANFVTRLQKLSVDCDFGEAKNEHIRDQVIEKCRSSALRRRLLREKDLTLEKTLELGRTLEMSEQQAEKIEEQSEDKTVSKIHTSSHQKKLSQQRQVPRMPKYQNKTRQIRNNEICYRCGQKGHYSKQCLVTRGKTCKKCGKSGHFAKMCKTKRIDYVNEQEYSDTDERVFSVNRHNSPKMKLTINDRQVDVTVDTGASVNIMDETTYNKLAKSEIKLERSHTNIYTYGAAKPLKQLGTINTEIKHNGKTITALFHVIPGSFGNLLSGKTASVLGIIHMDKLEAHMISSETEKLLAENREVFEGIGKLKNFKLKLHIDQSVAPVAQPARRLPYHLREAVEKKLNELENDDIIEKVQGPTPWVSGLVVVPKSNNDVRICVDMRQANRAIQRERFPIPNVEDTLQAMNSASIFSKLDLRQGFHQVELAPESREITTFACHKGLFRYKRLMFGVSSAPEIYQRIIQHTLQGIEGCKNISDDIIVYGKDRNDHDRALKEVFERLKQSNLTLNIDKCEFYKSELRFMGHILSKEGIKIDDAKVRAIKESSEPKNAQEVRSFLGLVNYCARFIPNLATVSEPLRMLTRKSVPWKWESEQSTAFKELKDLLTSAKVMVYYKPSAESRLMVDASPYGLGAIFEQRQDNGEFRTVAYASRTLNDVERRYSQTEREALGVLWACQHFETYLYGTKFSVVTDHKPLVHMFKPKHNPPARIQRWLMKLQPFTFDVIYIPGPENAADMLSRSRIESELEHEHDTEEYIRFVMEHAVPVALTIEDIKKSSANDEVLSKVREFIQSGKWEKTRTFNPYYNIRNELTVQGEVVLKHTRIVIPQTLRGRILELAHESHQGIVKTKNLLREKVWWPNMDADAENIVKSCHACQVVGKAKPLPKVRMSELPDAPWKKVGMDLCGPFPSGESLLVIVDYYSRYPEVEILKSVTSEVIIQRLVRIFAIYGIPEEIVTDNGRQFISDTFETFLKRNGIKHHRVLPYWPSGNGEVERFNATLKKTIKTARIEKRDWKFEIYKFLLNYRNTPHETTKTTPALLLFNRSTRTKLPQITQKGHEHYALKRRDREAKEKIKFYADRHRTEPQRYFPGTEVLIKNQLGTNTKLSPNWKGPYIVMSQRGTSVKLRKNGTVLFRNVTHIKPYHQ